MKIKNRYVTDRKSVLQRAKDNGAVIKGKNSARSAIQRQAAREAAAQKKTFRPDLYARRMACIKPEAGKKKWVKK